MVETEARPDIDQLNARLGGKLKLALVRREDVVLLEKNARFMKQEKYRNLVDNIRRDGVLSSVPLCWKREDGLFEVMSGNHRLSAAFDAGLDENLVLYSDEALSRSERIAIQLSHNSLAGEDDPGILAELWAEIDDLALKYYSGLDDIDLDKFKDLNIQALSEESLSMFTLQLMFFEPEAKQVANVLERAGKKASQFPVYAAGLPEYDRLIEAIDKARKSYNIANAATALMLILDVFERHQEDLAEGWERETRRRGGIPISTVIGTDLVPLEVAQSLKKELKRMGNPKNPEALLTLKKESTDSSPDPSEKAESQPHAPDA